MPPPPASEIRRTSPSQDRARSLTSARKRVATAPTSVLPDDGQPGHRLGPPVPEAAQRGGRQLLLVEVGRRPPFGGGGGERRPRGGGAQGHHAERARGRRGPGRPRAAEPPR